MPERRTIALLLLVTGLAACRTPAPPGTAGATVTVEDQDEWRGVALSNHAGVAEETPPLFRRLVVGSGARSRRRGGGDRDLLDPDLVLPRATPAPGGYRCRLVRLGATPARERARAREAFCFVGVEGNRLSLTVETPARRLGGFLWETRGGQRLVFLGAEFAPRERTAPAYGDPSSTAGIFERIGDFRYRLIVRGAVPETLDIWELVAAPG